MRTSTNATRNEQKMRMEPRLFGAGSLLVPVLAGPPDAVVPSTGPGAVPAGAPAPVLPQPGFLLEYCGYRVGEWPDSSLDGLPGTRY